MHLRITCISVIGPEAARASRAARVSAQRTARADRRARRPRANARECTNWPPIVPLNGPSSAREAPYSVE